MTLAPRPGTVLAAFGIAAFGVATVTFPGGQALGPVAGWLAGLFATAATADAVFTLLSRKPSLHVERIEQPSLGKPFVIELVLSWEGTKVVRLRLSLEEPMGIRYRDRFLDVDVQPDADTPVRVEAEALRRGPFALTRAFLEGGSRLGLFRSMLRPRIDASANVLPDLSDLTAARLLTMAAGRREGPLRRKNAVAGSNGEYYGLREYSRGEDARRIDWKVSAKSISPLVREKVPDNDALVAFAIDSGRLMMAERNGRSALDHAMAAMLACADAALRSGDRVCATVFADSILGYTAPSYSRTCMPRLARFAATAVARKTESDFRALARHLGTNLPKRSLVVIITEASDTMPIRELDASIAELARRHAVILAFLRDSDLEAMAGTSKPGEIWEAAAAAELLELRDQATATLSRRARVAVVPPEKLSLTLTRLYLEAKGKHAI